MFAYPYEAVSDEVVERVRAAGFGKAVTCEARALANGENLLRAPRLEITPAVARRFRPWLLEQLSL